jgi:hypothetical protein
VYLAVSDGLGFCHLLRGVLLRHDSLAVVGLELLAVKRANVELSPQVTRDEPGSFVGLCRLRTTGFPEGNGLHEACVRGVSLASLVRLYGLQRQLHQVCVEPGDEVWHVLHLRLKEGAHLVFGPPHGFGDVAPVERGGWELPDLSDQVPQCIPVELTELEADRHHDVAFWRVCHSNPVAWSRLHGANDLLLNLIATLEVLSIGADRADEVDRFAVHVVDSRARNLFLSDDLFCAQLGAVKEGKQDAKRLRRHAQYAARVLKVGPSGRTPS